MMSNTTSSFQMPSKVRNEECGDNSDDDDNDNGGDGDGRRKE